jgi:sulfate transport system substrate-binding protein
MSILAEPPVAIIDRVVDRKGTRALAQAYLEFLYTPEGQEIIARHHYRPRDPKVLAKHASTFAKVTLFTVDEAFGGWQAAQKVHFADRGTFDQIYRPGTGSQRQ